MHQGATSNALGRSYASTNTHTVRSRRRFPLKVEVTLHRPKSFEIAAHCGGCMRRSGASDGGTKGALASLRKRPSARSMSLEQRQVAFFLFHFDLHAVVQARGRWHGINSGAVVSRPAGTVGFEGHATSRESQLAPSTCVRRTSAQAVRCSHQPRAGCGAAAEVGAAIRSLRDSRSEEPSDSESASCFWAGKRESSRPGPLGKFRRS